MEDLKANGYTRGLIFSKWMSWSSIWPLVTDPRAKNTEEMEHLIYGKDNNFCKDCVGDKALCSLDEFFDSTQVGKVYLRGVITAFKCVENDGDLFVRNASALKKTSSKINTQALWIFDKTPEESLKEAAAEALMSASAAAALASAKASAAWKAVSTAEDPITATAVATSASASSEEAIIVASDAAKALDTASAAAAAAASEAAAVAGESSSQSWSPEEITESVLEWKDRVQACLKNPPRDWEENDIRWFAERQLKVCLMMTALDIIDTRLGEYTLGEHNLPYHHLFPTTLDEFADILKGTLGDDIYTYYSDDYCGGSGKFLWPEILEILKLIKEGDMEAYGYCPIWETDADSAWRTLCTGFFFDKNKNFLITLRVGTLKEDMDEEREYFEEY